MATTSLLKANPSIWKSNFSFPSPSSRLFPNNNLSFIKPTKFNKTLKSNGFTKFSTECFSPKHSKCKDTSSNPFEVYSTSLRSKNDDTSKNPFELVANTILKTLEALKKPAAATILIGFLLVYGPRLALAAPGGRMGGSAFSSRSSSSRSSSSRCSSSNSSSRSSSSNYSSSPSSSRSSSSNYSSSRSSSRSSSSNSSSSPSSSNYSSSPSSSRSSSSTSNYSSSPSPSPSSSYSFSSSCSSSNHSPTYSSDSASLSSYIFMAFVVISVIAIAYIYQYFCSRISVLMVQVGLLGEARSLQKDLNQIAEITDTSTVAGLSYILTETALSLLRHTNYWISSYSSVNVTGCTESAEHLFNKLSIAERAKFDEETLVNVNNKRKKSTSEKFDEFNNEYIVVTILVAADRKRELPAINGSADLMEALERLGSIPQSEIKAVEALWTPQEENGTLSEQELHGDYPHLRPL